MPSKIKVEKRYPCTAFLPFIADFYSRLLLCHTPVGRRVRNRVFLPILFVSVSDGDITGMTEILGFWFIIRMRLKSGTEVPLFFRLSRIFTHENLHCPTNFVNFFSKKFTKSFLFFLISNAENESKGEALNRLTRKGLGEFRHLRLRSRIYIRQRRR